MKKNKVNILIAEDSKTQAVQLQYLLEKHGYSVEIAENGRVALDLARKNRPSLVISDIVMPELDGYGLCRAIKEDENLHEVPVILVTSLLDSEDVVKGLESGADNFIRKPYEERYLMSRIEYLLMNLELRENQKMRMGIEIRLGGKRHFITAERQQILDLLISTYEQAIHINDELKAREQDLAHSNQVLNGLYHMAEGLNEASSEKDVAETALIRALELPSVRAGWIFLLEGESGFRVGAACKLPFDTLDGDCMCQRSLLRGELNHAGHIVECERLQKIGGDIRFHASIPLSVGERRIGLMNLVGLGDGSVDEDELKLLHNIGDQVAVALERARLYEKMEKLVEERTEALRTEVAVRQRAEAGIMRLNRVYAVLSGINTTIVRVREEDELFRETCRIAVEHGRFAFAWIGKLDAQTQQLTPAAWAGREDGYLSKVNLTACERGCVLIEQALTEAKPMVCNDIAADERLTACRSEALSRDYRSMAVFPLILEGRPVGVFALYSSETGAFDAEEMRLLIEMACDISFALDHLKKETMLNYLAYYDVLTELPNRNLLFDRLNQILHAEKPVAVLVMDLERFRIINETLGRHAGDKLLRQIAQRLSTADLDKIHLARIGGDSFGAILDDFAGESDVVRFIQGRIAEAMARPFSIEGIDLRVAVRFGIAMYPANGRDADTLFRNAEAALKKAKLSGDRHLFYTPEINARVAEKLSLENKLRVALEQEQFVLHYQPKVDLRNGGISAVEALIRWKDPDGGLVPPAQFIPLLEETGLILEVGRWALEKAVSDSAKWREAGLKSPRIAVNVSQHQLKQKDFVAVVEKALGGEASCIDLEITESLIMQNIEANIEKLALIRAMGVEIAIDDFGTGYSSLSYIAKLPVNSLKIDRSFIINMASNSDDMSIVSTIIALAHSVNMKVIAEGVETLGQASLLKLLKCDEMQGYLFSPAVPQEDVSRFIAEGKSLYLN